MRERCMTVTPSLCCCIVRLLSMPSIQRPDVTVLRTFGQAKACAAYLKQALLPGAGCAVKGISALEDVRTEQVGMTSANVLAWHFQTSRQCPFMKFKLSFLRDPSFVYPEF